MRARGWQLRRGEDLYPSCLELSPRPPDVLYGYGDVRLFRQGLAVVGARKATPYGLACARRFAGWAARQGIPVVSGAAIGCDQAAHRAALDEGGPTIAVLGCGADVDYPSGASRLLDAIRDKGVVVSELPWGTRPNRWTFPERNRIIAAMSAAVLVVEAALPSGTFSTADAALEAGRDVLAVPGSIFARECRGPNRLIRQGAVPVTDVSELAETLGSLGMLTPSTSDDGDTGNTTDDPLARALLADPMRPDDVVAAFGLDIVSVSRRLARLEATGVVVRYRDGRYGPGDPR